MKNELLKMCFDKLNIKINALQVQINDLKEELENETKSSVGDKYETTRAMVQIEIEKLIKQLQNFQSSKNKLKLLPVDTIANVVGPGNIVKTDKYNYFIAESIGEVTVGNQNYFVISPMAPIAKALVGKSVGDEVNFNANQFKIIEFN